MTRWTGLYQNAGLWLRAAGKWTTLLGCHQTLHCVYSYCYYYYDYYRTVWTSVWELERAESSVGIDNRCTLRQSGTIQSFNQRHGLKTRWNTFLVHVCCTSLICLTLTTTTTKLTVVAVVLMPVIVFILSFLLLNLVTTISDRKDIYMNYPDVTQRCITSHLYHAVSLSTCNVI